MILVGPAPETVAKVQDYYKMVLYMRHENREILVRLKDALEKYIAVNKGFRTFIYNLILTFRKGEKNGIKTNQNTG